MFLIAKIVRGRRLLHELEQAEHEAALEAAQTIAANSRRALQQHRQSSPGDVEDLQPVESCSSASTSASRTEKRNMKRGSLSRAQSCRAPTRQPSTHRRRKVARQPSSSVLKESVEEEKEEEETKALRQKTDGSAASADDDASVAAAGGLNSEGENLQVRRTSSMPSICEAQTVRPSAQALRHYDYERKLNKQQKRALRFTWHRLHTRNGGKRVESVFEEVFERLQKQLPAMRDMFTTRTFLSAMSKNDVASLRDHARVTVRVVDAIIKNLDMDKAKRTDTGGDMDPRLLGKKHGVLRPYGFTGNYFEKLGEVIIDVVLAQEAVRDLPGAGQAWVILTACLVDQLRIGFDESKNAVVVPATKANTVLHYATQHLHYADSVDVNDEPISGALPTYTSPLAMPTCPVMSTGPRRTSRPESNRTDGRRASKDDVKLPTPPSLTPTPTPTAIATEKPSEETAETEIGVHKMSLTKA